MNQESVPAWPNQAEAAEILGVHQATLLRSKLKLQVVLAGAKEKRFAPGGVLAAAVHFRRRPLREVAADLVAIAERKYPSLARSVAGEVDALLAAAGKTGATAEELLKDLENALPPTLYRRLEATYKERQSPTGKVRARKARKAPADKSRRASNAPA